jgi:hypothetical protein
MDCLNEIFQDRVGHRVGHVTVGDVKENRTIIMEASIPINQSSFARSSENERVKGRNSAKIPLN